ncbi:MAG: hypothetical protein GXP62_12770 [Oligoflexia bacterium]|nr:hypothetical protein [Oligoflexia bacterium]
MNLVLNLVLYLGPLACSGPPAAVPDDTAAAAALDPLTVMTFNTGTGVSAGLGQDGTSNGGYTSTQAKLSDTWYGNGLAWQAAVDDVTAFIAQVDPDIVVFQEIFYSGDCASIPADAQAGFVCEGWQDGDPTVAQLVLGSDYQVACNPGHPDKCAAVHQRVGRFVGCDDDFCLEGLAGSTIDGCGSGARIGRGVVERPDGSRFTVVNVHGSSGVSLDDQACRVAQVDQVFVDLGDGEPGANGTQNLVMGDLNTDPGRFTDWDTSAARWTDFVGEGLPFHFISEVGPDAPLSYQGVADIDHVMSDSWQGSCWYAGLSDGHPAATDITIFDHRPVVCTVAR